MESIYFDKTLNEEEIRKTLSKLFPDLEIFHWDQATDIPLNFNSKNSNHIYFCTSFDEERKEFACVLDIYRTPKHNSHERQLFLAKYFSENYKIRTLAAYTHPDRPSYPYYDIIFEDNKSFLADDSDTNFGDRTENLIKIIQKIDIPDFKFDSKANMLF